MIVHPGGSYEIEKSTSYLAVYTYKLLLVQYEHGAAGHDIF